MIKPINKSDSTAFTSLAINSGLFPAEAQGFLDQMLAEYFEQNIHQNHKCIISSNKAGQPVGVAYYEPAKATDRVWYLTMIAVAQETQGQGVGAALMEYVEGQLKNDGQRMLLVETSGVNEFELTRRFYLKCGYEHEATVRDYYEDGDDMVLYKKVFAN